ncbi:hypothetical protein EV127DRAFT_209884 [Xylaria flabelliformis]|nr:hypothetical protein EV127DRAFT_209884 [Xylaria flabelliformis]
MYDAHLLNLPIFYFPLCTAVVPVQHSIRRITTRGLDQSLPPIIHLIPLSPLYISKHAFNIFSAFSLALVLVPISTYVLFILLIAGTPMTRVDLENTHRHRLLRCVYEKTRDLLIRPFHLPIQPSSLL